MSWKLAPISMVAFLIACGQLNLNNDTERDSVECQPISRLRAGVGLALSKTAEGFMALDAFTIGQPECVEKAVLEYEGVGVLRRFEDRAIILDQTPDAATVQFIEADLSLGAKLSIDSECMPVDALPLSNDRIIISCQKIPHLLVWEVDTDKLYTVIDLMPMSTGMVYGEGEQALPGMDQMAMDEENIYVTTQDLMYNSEMDKMLPVGPGGIAKISKDWFELVGSLDGPPGYPVEPFWRPQTRMAQLSTGEYIIGCGGNGMGGPEGDPTVGIVKLSPGDITKHPEIIADSIALGGVPKEVVVTRDDRIFTWVGAPSIEDMHLHEEEGVVPPPGMEMFPPVPGTVMEIVPQEFSVEEGNVPEDNFIGVPLPIFDAGDADITTLQADIYGRIFFGLVSGSGVGTLGYTDVTKDNPRIEQVGLSGGPTSIILF